MKDTRGDLPADGAGTGLADDWMVIRRRNAPETQVAVDTRDDRDVENRLQAVGERAAAAVLAGRDDVARDLAPVALPRDRAQGRTMKPEKQPVLALDPYAMKSPPVAEPVVIDAPENDTHNVVMEPPADLWKTLPRVPMGAQIGGKRARRASPHLTEYFRADPIAKGFDLLRTRLVRTTRAYDWRRIAVVSPTRGCGTTFTSVNLALSLSRVPGSRTILLDMNQRDPGVADALGLRSKYSVDQFLGAEVGLQHFLQRPAQTLAVGANSEPCDFAAEVLHDPLTAEVLDDMIETLEPGMVIYDLPPILEFDDLAAFLPQVDGVLLVADGTQTVPSHISACERLLEGHSQLLGVVLNRGRAGN